MFDEYSNRFMLLLVQVFYYLSITAYNIKILQTEKTPNTSIENGSDQNKVDYYEPPGHDYFLHLVLHLVQLYY